MLVLKAIVPSFILTVMVSAIVASSGSSAAFLNLQQATVYGHPFDWSWPLFLASSALCWGLLLLME
jgi:hypothetical protein